MNRLVHRAWLLVLLPACSALAGCGQSQAHNGPPPPQIPEVSVSLPVIKEVTDYEDFPGRIEAKYAVEVRARVTGFLEKVHFREGTEVKKGDLLFEIDARPYVAELARAEGAITQGEGRLKRLEADHRRAMDLSGKGAIAREDFDKVVGDRTEALGTLEVSRAARDLAKLNVEFTKVRASQDGRISRRFIDPGNMVKADETALTTIVSLDPIYAYFDFDERSTLKAQRLLREGKVKWDPDHPLPLFLGLADEEGQYPRRGEIDFADNRVDPDTGTWRLRATFQNPDGALYPGLYVRVRVPIGQPYKARLVSEQALGTDQGQKFIYVVDKAGKVDKRRVKVGRIHDGLRAITDGLKPGEQVIVNGLQRVRPEFPVRPQLVAMPVLSDPTAPPKSETRNPKSETNPKSK